MKTAPYQRNDALPVPGSRVERSSRLPGDRASGGSKPQSVGTVDLLLTAEQAVALAPLLTDLGRTVVIGSVHVTPYEPGLPPESVGQLIARVGSIPRERMEAVRQAATGVLRAKRPAKASVTRTVTTGAGPTTNLEASAA